MKATLKLKPLKGQLEVYQGIRKPLAGPSKAHRAKRGEYRRPQGGWQKWTD